MKSTLTIRTAVVLIVMGLTLVTATAAIAADTKPPNPAPNPAAVNSVRFSPDGRYLVSTSSDMTARIWEARKGAPSTAIDPATGLPLPPLAPWKDPNWPDPDKVLPEVVYDGLPPGEIARLLRKEFNDAFDVLIPNGWQDPNYPAVSFDPQSLAIKMQLKNVAASEVFNAMNLLFDAENTPCRWELKLNGNRPTAMLRVLPERLPAVAPSPAPERPTRMVYFVGDLIGDEKSGGMTMEQLVNTVSDVYQMSYGPAKGVLQFHKQAQLLIVTGIDDQILFVHQTLAALREKARTEGKLHKAQPQPATEDTKTR